MSEQGEEREHQATAKHLDEFRERGDVLRSKDLSGGLQLGMAIIALVFMSNTYFATAKENFIFTFHQIGSILENHEQITNVLKHLAINTILMIIPLFVILYLSAFFSVFIFGGWNFTFKALKFNFDKLNPINNLSNMFSSRLFIDIGKSFAKLSIIGISFYLYVSANRDEILTLCYFKPTATISIFFGLIENFLVVLIMGIIIIMSIDALVSYFNYQTKTKMTSQEVKDEHKQTEGNVDVKRKLRRMQIAVLRQKIPQVVPKATVVITNPTHYAVALQYNENKDHAPKVIAKGKGSVAAYIRKLAVQHGVPIYEEPPLARAIYHTSKTNSYINPGLYMAVAIVLTYINQVRRYQSGLGQLPQRQSNLKLPPEFIFKD